jgi:hypothetical protein
MVTRQQSADRDLQIWTEEIVGEALDGPTIMPLSPSERLAALHDHNRDLRKHEVR